MGKSVFLVILSILTVVLHGQNRQLDSLQQLLQTTKEDTSRILLMNDIAVASHKADADHTIRMLKRAMALAQKLQFKRGEFELYSTLGLKYAGHGHPDSALIFFQSAYQIAQGLESRKMESIALKNLGAFHNAQNRKRVAIDQYHKALALAEEIDDVDEQAHILNKMGQVYSYLGKQDSSEHCYQQVVNIYEQVGDRRRQAGVLMNMGNNAARNNDLAKAIGFYEQANTISRQIGDKHRESVVFRMMGYTCAVMSQYPQALDYYQKALKLAEEINNSNETVEIHEAMANIYLSLEEYESALASYERAFEIGKSSGLYPHEYALSVERGRVYLYKRAYDTALEYFKRSIDQRKAANLGDYFGESSIYIAECYEYLSQFDSACHYYRFAYERTKSSNDLIGSAEALIGLGRVNVNTGNDKLAIVQLEDAVRLAEGSGNMEQKMDAAELLAKAFESVGNTSKSLEYFKTFHALRDTIFSEKNVKQIALLEAGYEFEKEKQQLEFNQQNEIKQQRSFQRIILIALGISLLFLFTLVRFYRSKQKSNKALNQLNKELEAQNSLVEEQKEKLEELDEAKTRFFTNISHEFRTPLTIISGMSGQIKNKPEIWLDRGTDMIRQNALNLLNLVNQILDLGKLESRNLELQYVQGDVIQYLRYVTESYQAYANGHGVQLHFLSTVPELTMDYDPDKLLKAVSNLLSNAIKYTPESGNIYFQIDRKEEISSEYLILRIEDTGSGIPTDQLDRIFDRFYQVDDSQTRKGEGTGIGLALTKELIDLMQGSIEVKSEVEKGTVFIIRLPIFNNAIARDTDHVPRKNHEPQISQSTVAPDSTVGAEESNSLPVVLIVEDNPDVVQFLIACLETKYKLAIARNGQEGIDLALKDIPDLIVSDVMMPEKDGFELCDTLKNDEKTSHIPIILLTAKADHESKMSGLEKGADAYLTKPFEADELLVRTQKLLELRQKLQKYYSQTSPEVLAAIAEPSAQDVFLKKIYDLIDKNLSNSNYGILWLSRDLGMSRSQVFRKVKALTGKSPALFIREYRLNQGKKLLQTTELSISEIAYDVGFSTVSYFSSAFLEEFGVRPSVIRK